LTVAILWHKLSHWFKLWFETALGRNMQVLNTPKPFTRTLKTKLFDTAYSKHST